MAYQRLALSSECMWASRPKAARDVFVNASLALKPPIPQGKLEGATRDAWKCLRFQVPEIAGLGVSVGEEGGIHLNWRVPTVLEVEEWVERSSNFGTFKQVEEFAALKEEIVRREGFEEDNANLAVHAVVGDGDEELVEQFQVMVYADHLVTDGIGVWISISSSLSPLMLQVIHISTINNQIIFGEFYLFSSDQR